MFPLGTEGLQEEEKLPRGGGHKPLGLDGGGPRVHNLLLLPAPQLPFWELGMEGPVQALHQGGNLRLFTDLPTAGGAPIISTTGALEETAPHFLLAQLHLQLTAAFLSNLGNQELPLMCPHSQFQNRPHTSVGGARSG